MINMDSIISNPYRSSEDVVRFPVNGLPITVYFHYRTSITGALDFVMICAVVLPRIISRIRLWPYAPTTIRSQRPSRAFSRMADAGLPLTTRFSA